jgi:hypothetical protein
MEVGMKKIIIVNIILILILVGCFSEDSKDNIKPQEVIMKNALKYEIFYECKGVFTEDVMNVEAKGTNVTRTGKILKEEIVSIGYVLASKSHGLYVEELSIYKDYEKKECIYRTNIFEPANIIITINKQGLIIDEDLINTFNNK